MADVPADLVEDADARIDFLLERDVFVERDGGLAVTEAFDRVRGIYEDTYLEVSDDQFRETIADVFGLSEEAAADRIEEHGVTRGELATYLALDSYLDGDVPQDALALLAAMTVDVAPVSPVPRDVRELTDDDYEEFLANHPDAAVLVFKRHCDPCDAMKADLPEIEADAPEGVAFAGVDGEAVGDFRREFDIEAAPTTLFFADGELAVSMRGRRTPAQFREAFADVY